MSALTRALMTSFSPGLSLLTWHPGTNFQSCPCTLTPHPPPSSFPHMHSSFIPLSLPTPAIGYPMATTPCRKYSSKEHRHRRRQTNQTQTEDIYSTHSWYLLVVARLRCRRCRIRMNFRTRATWMKAAASTAAATTTVVWVWRIRAGMSHPSAMCLCSPCWPAVSQQTYKHQREASE